MAEKQRFDIAVIGAGPGGYVAAIKAAQMGHTVALIEKQSLGGTCLNVGCIPSKTLLSNAQILSKIKHAEEFGINVGNVSFDYSKMKERKDQVVSKIRSSLGGLIKANGITIFNGQKCNAKSASAWFCAKALLHRNILHRGTVAPAQAVVGVATSHRV